LAAFEQAQRQQFFRKGLPAVILPVTEMGKLLLDTRQTQITRVTFIYAVGWVLRIDRGFANLRGQC
jgi:hypothetical protein